MSYSKFNKEVGVYAKWRSKNILPSLSTEEEDIIIRNRWIKDKRYKELTNYIIENWDSGNCVTFMTPLIDALVKDKKQQLHKQLWHHVVRNKLKSLYLYFFELKEEFPSITWDELTQTDLKDFNPHWSKCYVNKKQAAWYHAQYTLDALETYKRGAQLFSDIKEINEIDWIIEHLYKIEVPVRTNPKTADKRKMNDKLFWELIENSRAESEHKSDFIEIIQERLWTFKPSEIRKFDKYLAEYMTALNHWDIWALVYVARDGCGDDGFEDFKAWAVSMGEEVYTAVKNLELKVLKSKFSEDPQLETFIYLPSQVYESKTNKAMRALKVKLKELEGTPWDEDELSKRYPEIYKMFNQ